MSIDIRDSVLIFDEAHNIEDISRLATSRLLSMCLACVQQRAKLWNLATSAQSQGNTLRRRIMSSRPRPYMFKMFDAWLIVSTMDLFTRFWGRVSL